MFNVVVTLFFGDDKVVDVEKGDIDIPVLLIEVMPTSDVVEVCTPRGVGDGAMLVVEAVERELAEKVEIVGLILVVVVMVVVVVRSLV